MAQDNRIGGSFNSVWRKLAELASTLEPADTIQRDWRRYNSNHPCAELNLDEYRFLVKHNRLPDSVRERITAAEMKKVKPDVFDAEVIRTNLSQAIDTFTRS